MTKLSIGKCHRCQRPCRYHQVRLCEGCLGEVEQIAYADDKGDRWRFTMMLFGAVQ
jgi:hypothetical protein